MSTILLDDFQKLDIRIGTVIKAVVPGWSHWVIKLTVDFGPAFARATEGKRKLVCFSGIMKWFKPKDLEGKQFPFVINLEPKKIGPDRELSEAMMIMAVPKDDQETPTVLFKLHRKVPDGTKVR